MAMVQESRQRKKGRTRMVGGIRCERGDCSPRIVSSDHGSDQAVTLADGGRVDKPGAPLAVAGADGVQDTLPLHIHHNGVDGALVALGIQSHAPHNIRACLGSLLDEDDANSSADDGGEVHRSGVVN